MTKQAKAVGGREKRVGRSNQAQFAFPNGWGGRRKGAGPKPRGARPGVSHRARAPLAARFPVEVTMRVKPGLPSLRGLREHAALRAAIVAGCERAGFRLVHYSVQSNHLHLIVEGSCRNGLSRGLQGLAIRMARALNRLWRRLGSVFADRYHDRILRSPREVWNALRYVLNNARKHGAWNSRTRPDPVLFFGLVRRLARTIARARGVLTHCTCPHVALARGLALPRLDQHRGHTDARPAWTWREFAGHRNVIGQQSDSGAVHGHSLHETATSPSSARDSRAPAVRSMSQTPRPSPHLPGPSPRRLHRTILLHFHLRAQSPAADATSSPRNTRARLLAGAGRELPLDPLLPPGALPDAG